LITGFPAILSIMAGLQNGAAEPNGAHDASEKDTDPADATTRSSSVLNAQHPDAENASPKTSYSQYTKTKRTWRMNVTDFNTIVNHRYRGSGTENDPYIVEWLDVDPENPKAYTSRMRWCVTMLVAMMTLMLAFVSKPSS